MSWLSLSFGFWFLPASGGRFWGVATGGGGGGVIILPTDNNNKNNTEIR